MTRYIQLLIVFLILCGILSAQVPSGLTMEQKNSVKVVINEEMTSSRTLNCFDTKSTISALAVTGKVVLNDDDGLVRIVLSDIYGNKYLVMEVFSLICDKNNHFKFHNLCMETKALRNIQPVSLSLEITNANLTLEETTFTIAKGPVSETAIKAAGQSMLESYVDFLNTRLKEKGFRWKAGLTSVGSMSFEEKTALFGGRLPNLEGFEYYIEGIFETSASRRMTYNKAGGVSEVVPAFDWRNFQGKDWMTSVKSQGFCGSCWAFAAVGATEALINLYYNRQINMDLSEMEVFTCTGHTDCLNNAGDLPSTGLAYIINQGVLNETCLPCNPATLPSSLPLCSDKDINCPSPLEKIRIGGMISYEVTKDGKTADDIKRDLIKYGPMAVGIDRMSHAMVLTGFYPDTDGSDVWVFKNSFGTSRDNGYMDIRFAITEFSCFIPLGPITSMNYDDSDILCTDADNDGFYFWGIGPKPPHCPPCPWLEDGDDSDPLTGPMDENGFTDQIFASCGSAMSVNYPISDNAHIIKSGDYITASNTITGRAYVHLGAKNSVTLTTNFKVDEGSNFLADLNGSTPGLKSEEITTEGTEIIGPLNTDKNSGHTIKVYPNPVGSMLYVEGPASFNTYISDLSGRKMVEIREECGGIDVSRLEPGLYILHIESDGLGYNMSIVKE